MHSMSAVGIYDIPFAADAAMRAIGPSAIFAQISGQGAVGRPTGRFEDM